MKRTLCILFSILLTIGMTSAALADIGDLLVPYTTYYLMNNDFYFTLQNDGYDTSTINEYADYAQLVTIDTQGDTIYYDSYYGDVELYFNFGGYTPSETSYANTMAICVSYPSDANVHEMLVHMAFKSLTYEIANQYAAPAQYEMLQWVDSVRGSSSAVYALTPSYSLVYLYSSGVEQLGIVRN